MPDYAVHHIEKDVQIISKFGAIREELKQKVELEKHKYPISEREQMLIDTLDAVLEVLDDTIVRRFDFAH